MSSALYILCGIPFSGKSTLAKELAERKGFVRIDLDEVKFDMFGQDITDAELSQQDWDAIYQRMYGQIQDALKSGRTVVHDTGNFTKYERGLVRQITDELGVEATTIYVDTPTDVARERLVANRRTKLRFDVTDQEFDDAVDEMEAPDSSEPHVTYVTGTPLESWIKTHFGDA